MLAQRLRHKISIQFKSTSLDAYGENSGGTWATTASVFAAIEPLTAKEITSAGSTLSINTVKIIIRYLPNLTTEYRIIALNKIYDIKSVSNFAEKNRYMTLMCEQGASSGGS